MSKRKKIKTPPPTTTKNDMFVQLINPIPAKEIKA